MGVETQLNSLTNRLSQSYGFKQTVAASVLVLLVLSVTHIPWSLLEPVRAAVRRTLVEDYDFQRVLRQAKEIEVQEVIGRIRGSLKNFGSAGRTGIGDEFVAPVEGVIISSFGWRTDNEENQVLHEGLDIGVREGTPVLAAQEGVISAVRQADIGGREIEVQHRGGMTTVYAGLSSVSVRVGQNVDQGQALGLVGAGEEFDEAYLHFELHVKGKAVDPTPVIRNTDGL